MYEMLVQPAVQRCFTIAAVPFACRLHCVETYYAHLQQLVPVLKKFAVYINTILTL